MQGFKAKPASITGVKILVVDDEADIRKLVSLRISKIFPTAQIHESESGITAAFALTKDNFNIVISDVEMVDGDGFWLHCIMEFQYKETPLIFFTGNPYAIRFPHSRKVFSKDNMNEMLKEIEKVINET